MVDNAATGDEEVQSGMDVCVPMDGKNTVQLPDMCSAIVWSVLCEDGLREER